MPTSQQVVHNSQSTKRILSPKDSLEVDNNEDRNQDELTRLFSNLSTSDLNTLKEQSDNELSSDTGSSNEVAAEVICKLTEPCSVPSNTKTIRFADTLCVVIVRHRFKPMDHRKMGYRQVPNPWRRFGSLKTLHSIGGWITPRGSNQKLVHVEPGTAVPNDPKTSQMSLHQDTTVLNQKFFKFKLPRAADSQRVAYVIGLQIANSCVSIQPPKPSTKKPRQRSLNFFSLRR